MPKNYGWQQQQQEINASDNTTWWLRVMVPPPVSDCRFESFKMQKTYKTNFRIQNLFTGLLYYSSFPPLSEKKLYKNYKKNQQIIYRQL